MTGQDEWFPEYQTCIWIPTYVYSYEEAKNKCEAVGKVMMGTENYPKVMHLMNVTNASKMVVKIKKGSCNIFLFVVPSHAFYHFVKIINFRKYSRIFPTPWKQHIPVD